MQTAPRRAVAAVTLFLVYMRVNRSAGQADTVIDDGARDSPLISHLSDFIYEVSLFSFTCARDVFHALSKLLVPPLVSRILTALGFNAAKAL